MRQTAFLMTTKALTWLQTDAKWPQTDVKFPQKCNVTKKDNKMATKQKTKRRWRHLKWLETRKTATNWRKIRQRHAKWLVSFCVCGGVVHVAARQTWCDAVPPVRWMYSTSQTRLRRILLILPQTWTKRNFIWPAAETDGETSSITTYLGSFAHAQCDDSLQVRSTCPWSLLSFFTDLPVSSFSFSCSFSFVSCSCFHDVFLPLSFSFLPH